MTLSTDVGNVRMFVKVEVAVLSHKSCASRAMTNAGCSASRLEDDIS